MNAQAQHTLHLVQLFQSVGVAKRPRKKIPRQAYPKPIQRDYAQSILGIVKLTREAMTPFFSELPRLLESANQEFRQDAGESTRLRQLIEQARARLVTAIPTSEIENVATKFAVQTQTFQRIQLQKQVRSAFGVDVLGQDPRLASIMERFIQNNVTLIKDVPNKILSDVEKSVMQGVSSGKLPRDIAAELTDKFGFAEKRAKLIARDQVGKFYGQLNSSRQRSMGLTRFIWRTVGDDRVREEHAEREGEVYSYDDPPDGELPGEPINCRCYPEPYFEDLFGGEEAEAA